MRSEFCPGSVKGTMCSQGPLCCWLSRDSRGVTGREGGEPVLPTPPLLLPAPCPPELSAEDRNLGRGRGGWNRQQSGLNSLRATCESFWETSVHSPSIPVSHTPPDEHCWPGPACALSPTAAPVYLSLGRKDTQVWLELRAGALVLSFPSTCFH